MPRWRLNRLLDIDTRPFEKEMRLRASNMDRELENRTAVERLAWTFGHLANNGKPLQLLLRYEARINRT